MANRADLLERLCLALSRPGVDGVLATADILDDLLLLGALDGKVVMGSMNRGGLAGAAFELDDRFTGHRPEDIARLGFDAGKLLLRIDYDDPGSLATLESTARAIDAMAERRLPRLRRAVHLRAPAPTARSATTSPPRPSPSPSPSPSGLGGSSAYTWLKVPVTENPDDMAGVMETSTLPAVLLGGEVGGRPGGRVREVARGAPTPHRPGPGGRPLAAVPGGRRCGGGRGHRRRTAVTRALTEGHDACTVRAESRHGYDEFQLLGGESVFAAVTDRVHAPVTPGH